MKVKRVLSIIRKGSSKLMRKVKKMKSTKKLTHMLSIQLGETLGTSLMRHHYPRALHIAKYTFNIYSLMLRKEIFILDLTRSLLTNTMICLFNSERKRRCSLTIRRRRMLRYRAYYNSTIQKLRTLVFIPVFLAKGYHAIVAILSWVAPLWMSSSATNPEICTKGQRDGGHRNSLRHSRITRHTEADTEEGADRMIMRE